MQITSEDTEKLRELEESLWRSETRYNKEYMDNILAPGFFEFGRSGRIHKREDTLSAPTEEINAKLPLKDFNIHAISKDVVLVTYVIEVPFG